MGASTPRHHLPIPLLTKRIFTYGLYALLPLAALHYLLFSPPPPLATTPPPPPHHGKVVKAASAVRKAAPRCDYSEGEWVRSTAAPRYNGTSCGATIKAGQNCMAHGRPDTGYLHWRWRPRGGCALPPFAPAEFLELVRGRHVAFVGDSLARNQCESLVCLLTSEFPAELVRGDNGGNGGDGDEAQKFRRWVFRSHNATVSVFWSPFLVNGTEKSAAAAQGGLDHNRLYLDQPDERWAGELDGIDMVVLSVGHWFLHPAMYYERGEVIGCHHCPEPNRTETGFFGVFRLAVKNALREVITRAARSPSQKLAVVTTFSPAHFEGDWDARDACARSEPYAPGEKEVGYMDREMWRAEAEEVAAAAADARVRGGGLVEVEALEVTAMAALRGDAHPGPYMNAFPFAGGERARVPNDCVHWCLPGPIDTWNEILLQLVKTLERRLLEMTKFVQTKLKTNTRNIRTYVVLVILFWTLGQKK